MAGSWITDYRPRMRGSNAGYRRRNVRPVKAVACTLLLVIASVGAAEAQEGRWIAVEGTSRFRDMGGYAAGGGTVCDGMLFRSDNLSHISDTGAADLKRLGIVTIVDLREDSPDSDRIKEGMGGSVAVVHLPMVTDPLRDRNDYFKRMIVNSRQSLISLLILLSDKENLPLVMFDDDGVNEVDVAAEFVLLTLGVKKQDIISDYLLSNGRGAGLKQEWGEIIVRYFEEYGGMDYYITRILGLSSDQIEHVRKNLITQ